MVVVVVSMTALACGGSAGPTSTFDLSSFFPVASPAAGTAHVEALIATVAGSSSNQGLLDEYWQSAFADLSQTVTYHPPASIRSYPPDHPIDTACAGDEGGSQWNENAYYCPIDQSISWERNWLASMAAETGDLAPIAVFAHEWGHHIQNLTVTPGTKFDKEAQADCFSGAFFRRADDAGWLTTFFPGADAKQAVTEIYLVGNSHFVASAWYGNYGPPRSRQLAFGLGSLSLSPSICTAYENYVYQDPIQFGWYTLDPPAPFSVSDIAAGKLLQDGDVNVEVEALPLLADGTAADLFDAQSTAWFGSSDYHWTNDAYADPFTERLGGSSVIRSYQQTLTVNGTQSTIHGDVVLQADAGHGGLLFDVYLPGPGATTTAEQDQLTQWAAIVANGLCPGGVGTTICPTAGTR